MSLLYSEEKGGGLQSYEGQNTRGPVVVVRMPVPWIKSYTVVGTCRDRIPGFAKFTFMFGRSFFNDGTHAPVECVSFSVKCHASVNFNHSGLSNPFFKLYRLKK